MPAGSTKFASKISSTSRSTLRRVFRDPLVRVRRKIRGTSVNHEFAVSEPSPQQTIDIFNGHWITAFPENLHARAGSVNHFDPKVDPRVSWVDGEIPGGLAGKTVLELGPFEGYQTALLEWSGVESVVAVEASRTAFLKCLVVKELLEIGRASCRERV